MYRTKSTFKIILFFLILFSFFFIGFKNSGLKNNLFSTKQDQFRKIENNAFGIGEWLRFNISYGFIHAGTATMTIPEYQYFNGRQAYHIHTEARNASGFSWIFKVEDKYDTYIDCLGIFPWKFERHISEGSYRADDIAEFNQVSHKAYVKDSIYQIPEYCHDILSAFYFIRTQDFSKFIPGQKIKMQNFFKDKVYNLDVKYLGKLNVDVDAGEFRCILVEPLLKEGGLFKHQGRMIIWLTDDDRKLPVKVETGIIVGSITIELESYANLVGPLNSKIN